MTPISDLPATEDPRRILAEDFPSRGTLPIRGGWGYSRETACVIDRHDPALPPGSPFNGVKVEYEFVARRLWEEMIVFRQPAERFSDIDWQLSRQATTVVDGRRYDHLVFRVTALPAARYAELEAEWMTNQGNPDFDQDAHRQRRAAAQVHREVEYWFDITSFYPA